MEDATCPLSGVPERQWGTYCEPGSAQGSCLGVKGRWGPVVGTTSASPDTGAIALPAVPSGTTTS